MTSLEEVYSALTYRWQSAGTIRLKVAEARGKKRYQISSGSFRLRLNRLVELGFAKECIGEPTREDERAEIQGKEVKKYRRTGKPYIREH